jgi:hypothetical protein
MRAFTPLLLSVLLVAAGAVALEWALAARGFQPTINDSPEHWARERDRAAALGGKALVLLGASRIQLGVDTDVAREVSGLEPVVLAVDGSHFLPALQDVAADPRITGTVVVDYIEHSAASRPAPTMIDRYIAAYRRQGEGSDRWYRTVEDTLVRTVRSSLTAFADGGRPLEALTRRVIEPKATPQYLLTFPDRSRAADYARTQMPQFYLMRAGRELGANIPADPRIDWDALARELARGAAAVKALDPQVFDEQQRAIEAAVSAIQARGGRVVLVRMPSSGLVRQIEDRRTPRHDFWDRMARSSSAQTVHFDDVPGLAELQCPDGSHLDRRDRAAFTRILFEHIARSAAPARK